MSTPPGSTATAAGTPAERGVRDAQVAVLLVSHDGARWLPTVLEGLAGQRGLDGQVAAIVAVDTGSRDGSVELVRAAALDPAPHVVETRGGTSYPEAVGLGLDHVREVAPHATWVWLLHDDATPAPDALAALLAQARARPEAALLGPKLREWPSLRRLLEVGVTISGTGRRELGLERGEYDQGQHDEVREVLAVNTAGLLVRREVLEQLGGLDPQLPVFGNDLDLGWRAAAAGHTTLVVPQAVVFHAEAAHRGVRRTPLTGRHTHYQERRAALWTLLANAPARSLPLTLVRLVLGTLLRMLGFFLVRSPGEALDDLAALVSVYSQPARLRAARRERRASRLDDDATRTRVRELRAPWWLPYRHGLDTVGDVVSALTDQASDVAQRRRAAVAEADPSSMAALRLQRDASDLDAIEEDDEQRYADTGVVARFATNPVALLLVLVVVAALVLARPAYGAVVGGALAPVPGAAGDWWDLLLRGWHPLGSGTDVPAPAYLLPLALLASVVGTTATVSALMVLAVPLSLWGSWRLLRVVGRFVSPQGAPRWLLLAGSLTYALVPFTSGAWGGGRLGLVVLATVLPWLGHAALGFADPEADRRWRAAWRTGLLLALATAFAPPLWFAAVAVAVVVLLASAGVVRGALRDRSVWGPLAVALAATPVLLLPWWLPALLTGAGEALLLDTGRLPGPRVGALDLLAGRVGEQAAAGAPAWLGLVLLVLAVLALAPRATRVPVLICWVLAVVVAVAAAALVRVPLRLEALRLEVEPGLGSLVVLLQALLVTAAVLGALGAVRARGSRPARWLVVSLAVVAAVPPLGGLVWASLDGGGVLASSEDGDVPAYMVQRAETAPERGVLVVRGSLDDGVGYRVLRGDGDTLGEDEVLALAAEDDELTATVRELVSRPTPAVVAALGEAGVQYVVLAAPVDGRVAAGLDASGGLTQASADDRGTRAWEVTRELSADSVTGETPWWRVLLWVVQAAALLAVLVLCAPTVRGRRGR